MEENHVLVKYEGQEDVYVDKVVLCESESEWKLVKICVTLRIPVSDLRFILILIV